ncbi:MAG: type II toxin-antitoxin system Phd/YefM family antitoxin, partial [Candidatus Binatia bacterium]
MEVATISQLKDKLSAYLAKVKAGHSVLILDRNRPVARIVGVEGADSGDDRISRLERAGLMRRAKQPLSLED